MPMKLLYLENHPHFLRAVTQEFLYEYEVVAVSSIRQAKEAITDEQFDLILVDFDLDGEKGDEFVKFLRAQHYECPIIAVSSHEKGNEALMQAGANAQCSKMTFSKVQQVIQSLLNPIPQ
ncbi:Regulator of RpoS [Thalassocella blandensis]|nr:Regulator of RpoS [Thalassocella blandensis]